MFLPMIIAALALGKTFRLDQMTPERTIFVEDEIDKNIVVIENPSTRTEYKMIESSSDVKDFLDIEGELSLFQKRSKITIGGSGKYLFETVDRTKTVELLLSVNFQQKIETLPTYVKLQQGWESWKGIGTHYIRSIVYGGQLIVTYQMHSEKSENIEEIKAVVKANLETSGSVNLELQGKLEKISKDLQGKCTVRIYAFATGGIFQQPQDLEGAFKLIDEFPKLMEEYTKQKGYTPLQFELEPLSTLSPKIPQHVKRRASNEILDEAIDKYDDLRFAFINSKDFPRDTYHELEKKMSDFISHVRPTKQKMETAIDKLDMSKPFDVRHFDEVFKLYAKDGINIPNRYTRELNALLNAEKNFVPEWYPYTRAVSEYIHWGNVNCSLPSPDPFIVGFAASSPGGFGSGSDLRCLGTEPRLVSRSLAGEMKKSAINGLTYQTPDLRKGTLLCARCILENATSIFTVPSKTHCPEGTKLEYQGFLATGTESVTDPICIDSDPVDKLEGFGVQTDSTANQIVPVWVKCPKCKDYIETVRYVPCVVCSR